MAQLNNQLVRRSGLNPSFVAPSAADTFAPGAKTFYYAKTGTTATTYTFAIPAGKGVDYTDIAVTNLVVGPITSQDRIIGPFPPDVFADNTDGLVHVTTSNQTGVTVGVFDLSS